MRWSSNSSIMLVVLGLIGLTPAATLRADDKPIERNTPPAVADLIRQLMSPRETEREAASRQLLEREDALPALRGARNGTNADLAREAERILAVWKGRLRERLIERAARYARKGKVDCMVDALVLAGPTNDDDRCWNIAGEAGWKIVDLTQKQFPDLPSVDGEGLPKRDWSASRKRRPKEVLGPEAVVSSGLKRRPPWALVCAESIDAQLLCVSTYLLSSGPIGLRSDLRPSRAGTTSTFVFCGDTINSVTSLVNSVVVCDGDIKVDSSVGTIVIARGSIQCKMIFNSIAIAGGSIHTSRDLKAIQESVVRSDTDKYLDFVSFVEPIQIGLELREPTGKVRVYQVVEGTPAAKAGLQRGDILLAVDGTAADSIELFRRLLRRISVQDEGVVRVQREGSPRELVFDFRPMHRQDKEADPAKAAPKPEPK
jgi:hypothetical protein